MVRPDITKETFCFLGPGSHFRFIVSQHYTIFTGKIILTGCVSSQYYLSAQGLHFSYYFEQIQLGFRPSASSPICSFTVTLRRVCPVAVLCHSLLHTLFLWFLGNYCLLIPQ